MSKIEGLCDHERVIGHVCLDCPSGTAEDEMKPDIFDEGGAIEAEILASSKYSACTEEEADAYIERLNTDWQGGCRFHDGKRPCDECSTPEYGPATYGKKEPKMLIDYFVDKIIHEVGETEAARVMLDAFLGVIDEKKDMRRDNDKRQSADRVSKRFVPPRRSVGLRGTHDESEESK